MLPFEVIEIAAAAVSCAASGGLSLGSGGWTSSCATHARLVEVQDSESPPAGVDRTKCDEFASKGTTPGRGQSFPEGVETITRSSSSIDHRSQTDPTPAGVGASARTGSVFGVDVKGLLRRKGEFSGGIRCVGGGYNYGSPYDIS